MRRFGEDSRPGAPALQCSAQLQARHVPSDAASLDGVPFPELEKDSSFLAFVEELGRDEQHPPNCEAPASVCNMPTGPAERDTPIDCVRGTASHLQHAKIMTTNFVGGQGSHSGGEPGSDTTRTRAKNRRNQANYRARCKEQIHMLEMHIATSKHRLIEGRDRLRRLKHERRAIEHRFSASPLQPGSGTVGQQKQCPSEGYHSTDSVQQLKHTATDASAVQTQQQASIDFPHSGLSHSLRVARTTSYASGHSADQNDGTPRCMDSFSHYARISYALISPYVLPRRLWGSCRSNIMLHAVSEYQHQVCRAHKVQEAAVCWLFEFPFSPQRLPFSAGLCSPECSVSASLSFAMLSTEAAMLLLEHDSLRATMDSSFKPPPRPTLHSDDPITPPEPPHAGIAANVFVLAGADRRVPLDTATKKVVGSMLRGYRAVMPHATWRRVCMQSMRVLRASLDAMTGANPDLPERIRTFAQERSRSARLSAKAMNLADIYNTMPTSTVEGGSYFHAFVSEAMEHGGGDGAAAGAGWGRGAGSAEAPIAVATWRGAGGAVATQTDVPWEMMDVVMVTMLQLALCEMHAVLKERVPLDQPPQSRTLDQVHRRMHELACSAGVLRHLAFHISPVTSRRLLLTTFMNQNAAPVQHERNQTKLYSKLQLTPDQRGGLRMLWHSWRRRRAALSQHLATTARVFMRIAHCEPPPGLEELRQQVSKLADRGAQPREPAPVATVPQMLATAATAPAATAARRNIEQAGAQPCTSSSSEQCRSDATCSSSGKPPMVFDPRSGTLSAPDVWGTRNDDDAGCVDQPEATSALHVTRGGSGVRRSGAPPAADCGAAPDPSYSLDSSTEQQHFPGHLVLDDAGGDAARSAVSPGAHVAVSTGHEATVPAEWLSLREVLALDVRRMKDARLALERLGSVHKSDGLMHHEFCMPHMELDEVQHMQLLASQVELGVTAPDYMRLFRTATEEQAMEQLFMDTRSWGI